MLFKSFEEDCPNDSMKTLLSYVNYKMNTKLNNARHKQTYAIANKKLIQVLINQIIRLENEVLQIRGDMMTNVIVGY